MKGFHKATATTGYLNCPSEAVEPSEAVKLTFGHLLGNVLEHPALFAAFGWYTIGSLGSIEINVAWVHASLQLHLRFITSIDSAWARHDNVDAP